MHCAESDLSPMGGFCVANHRQDAEGSHQGTSSSNSNFKQSILTLTMLGGVGAALFVAVRRYNEEQYQQEVRWRENDDRPYLLVELS